MINPKIPTHIATASTRVIHSRAAALGSVIVNTGAASATLTVYNNTASSGDIVAIIDCSNTATGVQRQYDVLCPQGITVVMAGGNADVTVTTEGPSV